MRGGFALGLIVIVVGFLVVATGLSGRTAAVAAALVDPSRLQQKAGK